MSNQYLCDIMSLTLCYNNNANNANNGSNVNINGTNICDIISINGGDNANINVNIEDINSIFRIVDANIGGGISAIIVNIGSIDIYKKER